MKFRKPHYGDRPTKRAILAALNSQRPLDAPELTIERKKRRAWKEDTLDGIGGTDGAEKPE